MTLEDLMLVYDAAILGRPRRAAEHRIGVKAVVEALGDEISLDPDCYDCKDTKRLFREILASDGVQGAYGSPELDEDARKLEAMGQDAGMTVQDPFPEVFAPAAAPVCVWEQQSLPAFYNSGCGLNSMTHGNVVLKCQDTCPSCGKPISFKEGSE